MEEIIIRIENAALKLGKFSIKPAIINIPKGYIVGIQGDNGAGKSTMLRMLLGMYDKMQGNIYIDGIDEQNTDKKYNRHCFAGENIFYGRGCI